MTHESGDALVSADLAPTSGIDVARLDLGFLLAFAVTVVLGLRDLGVLLLRRRR